MRRNRGVDRQLGAGEASLRRGNGFFCLIVESPTRDSPSGDFAGPTWAVHHAEYVRSRLLNTEREPLWSAVSTQGWSRKSSMLVHHDNADREHAYDRHDRLQQLDKASD